MDQRLTNTINALRLPLCIGVISIHCSVSQFPGFNGDTTTDILSNIPSLLLTIIRVPLFYMIAGYLVGYRHPVCSKETYSYLVKRRTVSLLVPYILWNLFAFIFRYALKLTPYGRLRSDEMTYSSVGDWFYQVFVNPELIPLWFIRNLYLFFLALPLIYFLFRHLKIFSLILFWLLTEYLDCKGLFYFTLGIAIARYCTQKSIMGVLSKSWPLYPLFLIAIFSNAIIGGLLRNNVVETIVVLVGAVGFSSLVACRPKWFPIVSPGSVFFLYAFHGLINNFVAKLISGIMHPDGISWIPCAYVILALTIAISSLAWLFTNRFFPEIAAILTGRRRQKATTPL